MVVVAMAVVVVSRWVARAVAAGQAKAVGGVEGGREKSLMPPTP